MMEGFRVRERVRHRYSNCQGEWVVGWRLEAEQRHRTLSDKRHLRGSVLEIRDHSHSASIRSGRTQVDHSRFARGRFVGNSYQWSYSRCWGLCWWPTVLCCRIHSSSQSPLCLGNAGIHVVEDLVEACWARTAFVERHREACLELVRSHLAGCRSIRLHCCFHAGAVVRRCSRMHCSSSIAQNHLTAHYRTRNDCSSIVGGNRNQWLLRTNGWCLGDAPCAVASGWTGQDR